MKKRIISSYNNTNRHKKLCSCCLIGYSPRTAAGLLGRLMCLIGNPCRDNSVLYVSVSSAVTCLLIVFRDYNINVRPLQQTGLWGSWIHDRTRLPLNCVEACSGAQRAHLPSLFYLKWFFFIGVQFPCGSFHCIMSSYVFSPYYPCI